MRSIDFIADATKRAAPDLINPQQKGQLVSPYYEKVVAFYGTTLSFMVDRHPLSSQEIRDFNGELDRVDYYKQLMMRKCLRSCNPTNLRAYPTFIEAKNMIKSNLLFTTERKEHFKGILQVS